MRRRYWFMMRNWAKFGGFAGFVIAPIVCTFLWEISYPPLPGFGRLGEHYDCRSSEEREPTKGNIHASGDGPSFRQLNAAEKEEAKACRDERESLQKTSNERGLTVATWTLAFTTIFLVLATSGLWFFTGLLWKETQRVVVGGEKATKAAMEAVGAANRHADESAALVAITKETAERQLRAYISVTPHAVNWQPSGAPTWITVLIENHGQTIGSAIRYQFGAALMHRLPINAPMPLTDKTFAPNNSLFPRTSIPGLLNCEVVLTPVERRSVETDTRRFYMWGSLYYRDAFNKEERQTRFVFSFGGEAFDRSMRGIKGATWSWEYGQSHNDAT